MKNPLIVDKKKNISVPQFKSAQVPCSIFQERITEKTQCGRVAEQSEKAEEVRRRLAQPGQDFLAGDFHCSGRQLELSF